MRLRHAAPVLLFASAFAACAAPSPLAIGDQCELTSECDAPLVCRLGACRKECSTSRDCAAGLDCVLDQNKLGACQLPHEARCSLNSECPAPLVCTMGRCTNACTTSRDCPPGATCTGTPLTCVDPDRTPCIYNSDCDGVKICAPDQRCRPECEVDADCRYGTHCIPFPVDDGGTVNFCAPFSIDMGAGAPDAGTD